MLFPHSIGIALKYWFRFLSDAMLLLVAWENISPILKTIAYAETLQQNIIYFLHSSTTSKPSSRSATLSPPPPFSLSTTLMSLPPMSLTASPFVSSKSSVISATSSLSITIAPVDLRVQEKSTAFIHFFTVTFVVSLLLRCGYSYKIRRSSSRPLSPTVDTNTSSTEFTGPTTEYANTPSTTGPTASTVLITRSTNTPPPDIPTDSTTSPINTSPSADPTNSPPINEPITSGSDQDWVMMGKDEVESSNGSSPSNTPAPTVAPLSELANILSEAMSDNLPQNNRPDS
ncbi:hypothetical protein K501DRAFT_265816 [Backusella circina FSU 941]|nr:hypothetical protein K501DRAFT_265816 [Backusella circina FSU 941]